MAALLHYFPDASAFLKERTLENKWTKQKEIIEYLESKDIKEILAYAEGSEQTGLKEGSIENAEFICADSTDTQNNILKESDVVILDPPRKGITQELANKIAENGVENIVYVSCSPDTLARDIKQFTELGYKCEEATPFDMFPFTAHTEVVVALSKRG